MIKSLLPAQKSVYSDLYRKDFWVDCLVEFAAIVKLQHPEVNIKIELFSSVDEFNNIKKESTIDLLTGIRVEVEKDPQLNREISALQQSKMSPHSGCLFSDTTPENRTRFAEAQPGSVRQQRLKHFLSVFSVISLTGSASRSPIRQKWIASVK